MEEHPPASAESITVAICLNDLLRSRMVDVSDGFLLRGEIKRGVGSGDKLARDESRCPCLFRSFWELETFVDFCVRQCTKESKSLTLSYPLVKDVNRALVAPFVVC